MIKSRDTVVDMINKMTSLPLTNKIITFTTSRRMIDTMSTYGFFLKEKGHTTTMPIFVCVKGDDYTYLSDINTMEISLRRFLTMESQSQECVVCLEHIADNRSFTSCYTCYNITCIACVTKGKIDKCPICMTKMCVLGVAKKKQA